MRFLDRIGRVEDKMCQAGAQTHVLLDIAVVGQVALHYVFGVLGGEIFQQEGLLIAGEDEVEGRGCGGQGAISAVFFYSFHSLLQYGGSTQFLLKGSPKLAHKEPNNLHPPILLLIMMAAMRTKVSNPHAILDTVFGQHHGNP